jgi:NAD(P)-dependent dehydrogenase (short-subunit alcohol dehydrogenase family)
LHFLQADLSSQRSIHQLAQQASQLIQEKSGGKLDVLVNNAGAVPSWYTTTEDGYELQFAVITLHPFC